LLWKVDVDILSVTTFADIRAVLGVSIEELSDPTLSLDVFALNLEVEMRDLGVSVVSDYLAVLAKPALQRTEQEQWFFTTTKLFGTYAVAKHLLGSLPLFSPREITDGKAAFTRYAANPYTDTIKAVGAQYAQARSRVSDAYGVLNAQTAVVTGTPLYMAGGPAGYDPVTGV
jgi:hypothetical protein